MADVWTFLSGIVTAGFLAAALFFLRFWRRSGDGLFAAFALAFVLMAANSALAALMDVPDEDQPLVYLLRLFAFLLIIAAVLRKNMQR